LCNVFILIKPWIYFQTFSFDYLSFLFLFLGGCPNYYRNTFHGPDVTNGEKYLEHATFESGMAARHEANDDDNYSQPRVFYHV